MILTNGLGGNMNKIQSIIDNMVADFSVANELALGYPCNKKFDYSPLYPLLGFAVNNVGDAFADGNFRVNTHKQEREVLEFYQDLLHADKKKTWGYVNNGGTEGNIYAMYLASQKFPDATIYYSGASHYSIPKAAKLVGLKTQEISIDNFGEMMYDELSFYLETSDNSAIVFANVGTTFTGAIDRVNVIKNLLINHKPNEHYLHADAAFFGSTLPFSDEEPTYFDFRMKIDSISISGHKFLGSPIPCGVCLVQKEDVDRVSIEVSYVRTHDNTLSGSRNGITPMFLWYAINTLGLQGMEERTQHMFDMADYLISEFKRLGIYSWRNPNSSTVIFPLVEEDILRKYQIATEGNRAHIIGLPSTSKEVLDQFIKEVEVSLGE